MTGPSARRGLIALALLAAAPLAAQNSAPMTISGRVSSAATGKPVPGAAVTANCDTCDVLTAGRIDADGRFAITVGAPGRYRVFATAPGYLFAEFGSIPNLGSTPVAVARGEPVRDIDLTLHRGSTIAGVVTDEFKEPLVGATVRALVRTFVAGELAWQTATTTRTDDRGAYRLIGLDAGEYVVAAVDGLRTAFAASAMALTDARRVTVGADAEQEGVGLQMRAAPRGSVEGLVAGPGAGGSTPAIELWPDPDPAGLPPADVRLQPGGRFSIGDVPAGRYLLVARPGAGAGRRAGSLAGWARQSVVVAAGKTTHVAITLRAGARIAGAAATPAGPGRGNVQLAPTGFDHPEAAPASAALAADGSFTLVNVAPGRYRWVPTERLTNAGEWLMSVFIGKTDVTDRPLVVTADAPMPDVRIALTPPARIAGTVRDRDGRPTTAGAVVLAPADSREWSPLARGIQVARPDTGGGFEFRAPAGRYRLVHVETLAAGQLWDPAFLKTTSGGPAVTAVSGQTTTADVRLK